VQLLLEEHAQRTAGNCQSSDALLAGKLFDDRGNRMSPSNATIRLVVKTRILKRFGLNPLRHVQLLCPMNRGGVGARSLNIELQAALNPAGERKVERFGWPFAPGDKVMQIERPDIALVEVDAEPLGDDPLEIDTPPAHDAVSLALRASLGDPRKLGHLLGRKPGLPSSYREAPPDPRR
jgi:hypothetical protein